MGRDQSAGITERWPPFPRASLRIIRPTAAKVIAQLILMPSLFARSAIAFINSRHSRDEASGRQLDQRPNGFWHSKCVRKNPAEAAVRKYNESNARLRLNLRML